LRSS
jgi:hypothetical protein